MALLKLENLHVALEDGTEIVKGVDLEVSTNEVHAIMGPNGSGKSPLAYALMGHPAYEITEGKLRFDGEELSNAALVRASQDYRFDFLLGDPFESPLHVDGDVVFSCLKGAEDGDGCVLRVFNPNVKPERLELGGALLERIRLDEEGPAHGGVELAPGEIATFRLRPS